MTASPAHVEQARVRLTRAIAQVGPTLPGSLVVRHTRCGKPTCRCQAQPPVLHGPYIQWTRKVAGRTRSQRLSAEQYQRYAPWFANARRLRALLTELETLSLNAAAEAEGWPQTTRTTKTSP